MDHVEPQDEQGGWWDQLMAEKEARWEMLEHPATPPSPLADAIIRWVEYVDRGCRW